MSVLRSLIVTLGMNSAQYREDLKKSTKDTQTNVTKIKNKFNELKKSNENLINIGKATATAIAAIGIAIGTSTLAVAANVKEVKAMGDMLGYSYGEMQRLNYIAKEVNETGEQLADQFKDVQEKVGEFVTAGSGGMQDFFDVMRMSGKEANEFAEKVKDMAGPDVLKLMVSEMENAGASSKEMSFAVEGMASDLTRLLPVLTENAEAFDELAKEADELTKVVTEEDLERYDRLNSSVNKLQTAFGNAMTHGLSPFADMMADASDYAVDLINKFNRLADATNYYYNSLKKGTLEQKMSDIVSHQEKIEKIQKRLQSGGGFFYSDVARGEDEFNLGVLKRELTYLQGQYKKMAGLEVPEPGFVRPVEPKRIADSRGPSVAVQRVNKEAERVSRASTKNAEKLARQKEKEARELAKRQAEAFNAAYGAEPIEGALKEQYDQQQSQFESLKENLDKSQELMTDRYLAESELLKNNSIEYEEYIRYKEVLDRNYAAANLQTTSQMFGGISEVAKVFAGKQSGIYRGLYAMEKGYHTASVLMSSYDAITKAWASSPFPSNIPAVLQTTVETGALQAALESVALVGMAHDGIDSVPREGTWLLQQGERVVDSRTNADLKNYLSSNAGGQNINVTVDLRGTTGDKALDEKLRASAQSAYNAVLRDMRNNGPIYQNARK
ncbi:TPA: hypothetical protein ACX6NV_000595 [Photobacterium damselae]